MKKKIIVYTPVWGQFNSVRIDNLLGTAVTPVAYPTYKIKRWTSDQIKILIFNFSVLVFTYK